MRVYNSAGEDGIVVIGDYGIVVRDDEGKLVLAAEAAAAGKPAGLWLGTPKDPDGGGRVGLVVLRNASGQEGVALSGDYGIVVRDDKGKLVLAAEAAVPRQPAGLWLGTPPNDGAGRAGLVVLRDAKGAESILFDGATESISAGLGLSEGGAFSLRNAHGNEIFRIDYLTVDTIDHYEQHGRVRVKNTNGADTIVLDGRKGDITLIAPRISTLRSWRRLTRGPLSSSTMKVNCGRALDHTTKGLPV